MNNLISKIKELRSMMPDADFFHRSSEMIFITPQIRRNMSTHFWESFRMSVALSLGSLLLIIAVGGFSYLKLDKFSPFIIGGLNTKSIVAEAERAGSMFEIAEAKYFEDASSAIATALNTVSQNGPDHLNNEILEQELENIEKSKPRGDASPESDELIL